MSSFLLDDTFSDWEMTKTCQKFDVGLQLRENQRGNRRGGGDHICSSNSGHKIGSSSENDAFV